MAKGSLPFVCVFLSLFHIEHIYANVFIIDSGILFFETKVKKNELKCWLYTFQTSFLMIWMQ